MMKSIILTASPGRPTEPLAPWLPALPCYDVTDYNWIMWSCLWSPDLLGHLMLQLLLVQYQMVPVMEDNVSWSHDRTKTYWISCRSSRSRQSWWAILSLIVTIMFTRACHHKAGRDIMTHSHLFQVVQVLLWIPHHLGHLGHQGSQ